jgi:hypothetical protein
MADPLADPLADPPLADPMADPASSDACDPLAAQARSAARPGAIRCPPRRDPLPAGHPLPGAIRWPRSAARDPRSACQGPLWQLRLNGP